MESWLLDYWIALCNEYECLLLNGAMFTIGLLHIWILKQGWEWDRVRLHGSVRTVCLGRKHTARGCVCHCGGLDKVVLQRRDLVKSVSRLSHETRAIAYETQRLPSAEWPMALLEIGPSKRKFEFGDDRR